MRRRQDDNDRALDTAGRISDHSIRKQLGSGTVDEQSFTHGTSAEGRQWSIIGYESGDPARCDTFAADALG